VLRVHICHTRKVLSHPSSGVDQYTRKTSPQQQQQQQQQRQFAEATEQAKVMAQAAATVPG
jgi:hypothetical protein